MIAPTMENIRNEASRRVVAEGRRYGVNEFLQRLTEVSVEVWLDFFPAICKDLVRVNYEKVKLLKEIGTQGKYTESYGWSPDRQFKFEYEYTPEFYFFMTAFVYSEFFANENKKTYRRMMKKLMAGEDPMAALMWVKTIFGSNNQKKIVTTS